MSGSLLRRLQEAGLWLDLRQHLCNRSSLSQIHIYGFPANYPRFSSGVKVFRLEFSDIYPHRPRFLSFDVVDSGPSVCKHSFFPPLSTATARLCRTIIAPMT